MTEAHRALIKHEVDSLLRLTRDSILQVVATLKDFTQPYLVAKSVVSSPFLTHAIQYKLLVMFFLLLGAEVMQLHADISSVLFAQRRFEKEVLKRKAQSQVNKIRRSRNRFST